MAYKPVQAATTTEPTKHQPMESIIPLMFWEVPLSHLEKKTLPYEHIRDMPWHKLTGLTTNSFSDAELERILAEVKNPLDSTAANPLETELPQPCWKQNLGIIGTLTAATASLLGGRFWFK